MEYKLINKEAEKERINLERIFSNRGIDDSYLRVSEKDILSPGLFDNMLEGA